MDIREFLEGWPRWSKLDEVKRQTVLEALIELGVVDAEAIEEAPLDYLLTAIDPLMANGIKKEYGRRCKAELERQQIEENTSRRTPTFSEQPRPESNSQWQRRINRGNAFDMSSMASALPTPINDARVQQDDESYFDVQGLIADILPNGAVYARNPGVVRAFMKMGVRSVETLEILGEEDLQEGGIKRCDAKLMVARRKGTTQNSYLTRKSTGTPQSVSGLIAKAAVTKKVNSMRSFDGIVPHPVLWYKEVLQVIAGWPADDVDQVNLATGLLEADAKIWYTTWNDTIRDQSQPLDLSALMKAFRDQYCPKSRDNLLLIELQEMDPRDFGSVNEYLEEFSKKRRLILRDVSDERLGEALWYKIPSVLRDKGHYERDTNQGYQSGWTALRRACDAHYEADRVPLKVYQRQRRVSDMPLPRRPNDQNGERRKTFSSINMARHGTPDEHHDEYSEQNKLDDLDLMDDPTVFDVPDPYDELPRDNEMIARVNESRPPISCHACGGPHKKLECPVRWKYREKISKEIKEPADIPILDHWPLKERQEFVDECIILKRKAREQAAKARG